MRWWYPEDGDRKNLKYSSSEEWEEKTGEAGEVEKKIRGKVLEWEDGDDLDDLAESDEDGRRFFWRRVFAVVVVVFVVVGVSGWVVFSRVADEVVDVEGVDSDERGLGADEVVAAFLNEPEPLERLKYVRRRGVVEGQLMEYRMQALAGKPYRVKRLGTRVFEGRNVTSFSVGFRDRSQRMLNVVDTDEGPLVDWESYARHQGASWQKLVAGEVEEAEMRVTVMPGKYYNPPFEDRGAWQCYRLGDVDRDGDVFAFVKRGSLRDRGLRTLLSVQPDFRLHMILRVKRFAGVSGEVLYSIEEVVEVGWIRGEETEESRWIEGEKG